MPVVDEVRRARAPAQDADDVEVALGDRRGVRADRVRGGAHDGDEDSERAPNRNGRLVLGAVRHVHGEPDLAAGAKKRAGESVWDVSRASARCADARLQNRKKARPVPLRRGLSSRDEQHLRAVERVADALDHVQRAVAGEEGHLRRSSERGSFVLCAATEENIR